MITIGLTALFTWLTVANWNGPHAAARDARSPSTRSASSWAPGSAWASSRICVLGVLVITTEYSTGVIRASLLAVPRRLPMLTAKCVVFAALLFVLAEIVAFGSFFIGSAILHSHVPVSLSDHDVTRAVVGAGLYLTVLGLFSLAIGGADPAHRGRHHHGDRRGVRAADPVRAAARQLGRARQRLPAGAGRAR